MRPFDPPGSGVTLSTRDRQRRLLGLSSRWINRRVQGHVQGRVQGRVQGWVQRWIMGGGTQGRIQRDDLGFRSWVCPGNFLSHFDQQEDSPSNSPKNLHCVPVCLVTSGLLPWSHFLHKSRTSSGGTNLLTDQGLVQGGRVLPQPNTRIGVAPGKIQQSGPLVGRPWLRPCDSTLTVLHMETQPLQSDGKIKAFSGAPIN